MIILLTNDDGIDGDGLLMLAKSLSTLHTVYISAPDGQRSGFSHSVNFHKPIYYKEVDIVGVKEAYAVSGTPVDCVNLAIKLFKINPDVVISGPNKGANYGSDILYSGTVGAAQQSALLGFPSIAISSIAYKNNNYDPCCQFINKHLTTLLSLNIGCNIYNVNVPNISYDSIKGIVAVKQGSHTFKDFFKEYISQDGTIGYSLEGDSILPTEEDENTDVKLAQNGYITITPLKLDRTNYDLLANVEELFK